jgi:sugar/nucleoside kinase (ribokinase family)
MDFVVIGTLTKDLLPDGSFTLGGTVTYSAVTARNLELSAGIVTAAEPSLDYSGLLAGIQVVTRPSPVTTTFENIYHGHERQQFIRAVAEPIRNEDVPAAWRSAPIIHLGPLAQEISPDIVSLFASSSLVGVTPQGWMRCWGQDGLVTHCPWEHARDILARADALIFSKEDVDFDAGAIHRYAQWARVMVVTQNWLGCTVYVRGQRPRNFPAFRAREVDPTGAGDVFAAAYLIRYRETGDPYAAAHFANCVASFSVEGTGVSAIPTRTRVERRLRS